MRIHAAINGILTIATVLLATNALWRETLPVPRVIPASHPASSTLSHPIRLRIPARGIDAPIEPVGLLKDKSMGIPTNAFSVGWYAYGTVPGERGSAVLAGHRDTAWGTPGVFWTLEEIQVNDELIVETANGEVHRFQVHKTEEYPYDAAPMDSIFGATDGRFLNLITCTGDWNRSTYAKRLVVFTERSNDPQKSPPID